MRQGLGLQLRPGRRIGDDKFLVAKSRIAGKINLLEGEYFTLIHRPSRDRRPENRLSLCIADSYMRIMTPVNLNLRSSARTREKKIPSGWKQNGGIRVNRNAAAGKSQICLERECDAAADHAEVIVGTIHHIPTEVVHPADVGG